jgi:putative transposase
VFHLYATLEVPDLPPEDVADYLGVDFGFERLAADSDDGSHSGEAVDQQRRRYSRRRRNLRHKQTRAAPRKLRPPRSTQPRFQRATNHCICKALRTAKDTGRGLALENVKGIRERTTVRREQRARHFNWAFAQLRAFAHYKAEAARVALLFEDPRYPSHQTAKV